MQDKEVFYGWKVVAALFVMLTFSSGLGFYNHAVMLKALVDESALPITVVSTAVSIFFFVSGFAGLGIAVLIEKYDIRYTIAAGALMAGGSLALVGQAENAWQLYAIYIVFALGFSAAGLLPATTLVTRWFRRNRALALSVASTGLSIGGVTLTPVSALLIGSVGIASATPILGLAFLLGTLPISLLVLRSHPEDVGLSADGDSPVAETATTLDGVPFSQAIRQGYFWALSIAWIFVMMAQVGGIAHQYGIVSELLTGKAAALALGVLPLFSILGRLAGGIILGRVSPWWFSVVMMVMQAVSLAGLALAPGAFWLIVNLAVFGITVGNLLMLQPLLIAESWGLVQYSRIYSFANLLTMFGVALGPGLMGYLYAMEGAYDLPYLFAAGAGLFACVVFVSGTGRRS
ncbi:MAG: MFS transporter [Pseudomonadales bacterium]|nr:MFS transporter [Pseudomonadales bacterium]